MPWTTPGTAVAGNVLTAAQWNSDVRDNSQYLYDSDGLFMVRPTSVAGTGVTLSNGKVSFSASTTVSINGCFTSSFDNYRINFTTTSASANALVWIRMRLNGTDASGATDYGYSVVQSASAGAWVNLDYNQTGTSLLVTGYKTTVNRSHSSIDVYGPSLAEHTGFSLHGQYGFVPYVGGGSHNVATAYDGISFVSNSGNMTGNVRIYGYRNS